MKRSLAGLIIMSLGLIGIYVCVITKRPVDNIINICFLGGMLWSLFSSLFFTHYKNETIGAKSLIIIFTPIVIGVIVAVTGANTSFYVALFGLFVLAILIYQSIINRD